MFEFDKDALQQSLLSKISAYDPMQSSEDSRKVFSDIIADAFEEVMQPLITALNTHVHASAAPGSPTGPPTAS